MPSDKTRRNTKITKAVAPVAAADKENPEGSPRSESHQAADFSLAESRSMTPPIAEASLPRQLGRYEVTRLLGQGGMGAVYLARDRQLQRDVALKVPQWDGKTAPLVEKRFYREARAAANLSHPNLCPVYDVDEIDGIHCIAMALIKGKPLSDYVRPDKPVSPRSAAKIVQKVALAMEEAHHAGVIHRDLKPSNIMIDHRNEPIVMDFGLAKASDQSEESRLTRDGTLIGSPAYMSPEQLRGKEEEIGPKADQYALGIVLYELLSGRIPFDNSGSTITLLSQILTEPPQDLSQLRPELDPELVAIVNVAISKSPDRRFRSMKDFAQALRDHLRGEEPRLSVLPTEAELDSEDDRTRPIPAVGTATAPLPTFPSGHAGGENVSNPESGSGTRTRAERANRPTVVGVADPETRQREPAEGERDTTSAVGTRMLAVISAGGTLILLLGGISLYLLFGGPGDPPGPPPEPRQTPGDQPATESVVAAPASEAKDSASPGGDREANGWNDDQARRRAQDLLDRMDRNDDAALDEFEIPREQVAPMMRWDTNGDGELDRAELESMPAPQPPPMGRRPPPGFESPGSGPLGGPPGPGPPGQGLGPRPPGRRPGPGGNRPPF